jgi:hypothetical protein
MVVTESEDYAAPGPLVNSPHCDTRGAGRARLRRELLLALREHRLILCVIGAYAVAGLVVDLLGIVPGLSRKLTYTYVYLLPPLLVWIPVTFTLIRERFAVREDGARVNGVRGWVLAYRQARSGSISNQRLLDLLVVCCAVPVFMNLFGGWKAAIPVLHPFSYDTAFFRLDRVVHGGTDPWRLLQPLFGRPKATMVLDQVYSTWLLLVPAAVVWQAWNCDRVTRRQFFLAYVLTWILLGTIAATIWSSAGPCFYSSVTGLPSPYEPLMVYLRGVHENSGPLLSQVGQEVLWRNYLIPDAQPYTRISAMPSLHVAMPILYMLAAWRQNKALGIAFGAYAVVILVASVHLAWHYAVDGEASILLVPVIWALSGMATRRLGHV